MPTMREELQNLQCPSHFSLLFLFIAYIYCKKVFKIYVKIKSNCIAGHQFTCTSNGFNLGKAFGLATNKPEHYYNLIQT